MNLRVAVLETHVRHPRDVRARAVAAANIGPDRSKPSTEPPGATTGPIARLSAPLPHPTSSTRSPERGDSTSTTRCRTRH